MDGAQLPEYLFTQGQEVATLCPFLLAATVSAVIGILVGERLLRRIPEPAYRRPGRYFSFLPISCRLLHSLPKRFVVREAPGAVYVPSPLDNDTLSCSKSAS